MKNLVSLLLLTSGLACTDATMSGSATLGPGDHVRSLKVDGRSRSYVVHVPPQYDATKATPVVLAFHGAMGNGQRMVRFSGLNKTADSAGFVAVYPNGTGLGNSILFFNAGGVAKPMGRPADDVKFVAELLDDLAKAMNVDARRVYATGMSNGGMMCYRLAAELSDRIAAIAPVSGTQATEECNPKRPVPVMHFHGTDDKLVPFGGPNQRTPKWIKFKSVDDTVKLWAKLNNCPTEPTVTDLPDTAKDGTSVKKMVYGPGKDGAEVVLFIIKGGGHTWPGQTPPVSFIGKSTRNISANDLIWEFFQKHPMCGEFRMDFVINGQFILELKALKCLIDEHVAQVISYLKATGLHLGILLNFGSVSLESKRVVR
ncbi:MAG: GxxExxY protein [Planctomycetota bacterium]